MLGPDELASSRQGEIGRFRGLTDLLCTGEALIKMGLDFGTERIEVFSEGGLFFRGNGAEGIE